MVEPTIYARRRKALAASLAKLGVRDGLVTFPGNRESPINYTDNTYRFRQDSSFLYFFGIAEPDLAGSLELGSGRSTLYADEGSIDDLVWTGPRPSADDWRAMCAADAVRPRAEFTAAIGEAGRGASGGAGVHFLPPYRADTAVELGEALGLKPGLVADMASVPLIRSVVALREIKEPGEVEEIGKAVDLSIDLHRVVMRAARPGATEAEMMAEAVKAACSGGGMPSFPPIATTKGAVLHNHGYAGRLEAGGLFLLDAGAETAEGYAGDLTSTFPVGAPYSDRQRAIYDIVLRAGEAGSSMMKPGVSFRDIHLAAARVIAAGLKDLGIMKGNLDEAVAAGAHACFFPHGLGHQMGLDVHDMESLGEVWVGYDGGERSAQFGLKSLRMAKPLKAGMVMTMEPGVYFIEGLIASWESLKLHTAFIDYAEAARWVGLGGVRNEEDWLVTETGAMRLGKPFDKSVASMEAYLDGTISLVRVPSVDQLFGMLPGIDTHIVREEDRSL
jgi:Xaa-Pro aminopeptidase